METDRKKLGKSIFLGKFETQEVGKSALTIQLIQNFSRAFSDGAAGTAEQQYCRKLARNLEKKICESSDCLCT
ncbi:hypothetical protein B9Z55_003430 [Caenorhabditis nigoni]|uniref:Uncharacterized protein n=1 Tax=Caenorhabditis nigoni TaxID=1611254 RepID=A0A2G5VQ80_9PELO|nr:hypothetical protein B9Z55_003430 [Caenorhabditis nigoni]